MPGSALSFLTRADFAGPVPFVRALAGCLVLGATTWLAPAAMADEPGDGLVRLPGQGEMKRERPLPKAPERLAPGGGLLMSFDENGDGRVIPAEFEHGLDAAFRAADTNGDGQLTVFEQRDWAESLPTRDDTLANPVRFDPNLDRMVSEAEFSSVIRSLAVAYQDEGTGAIDVAQLQRVEPRRAPDDNPLAERVRDQRGDPRDRRAPRSG